MTELIHRKSEATGGESSSDEVGTELKPDAAAIPQGTDHTPRLLSVLVELLPQRWRNYAVRFVFTFVMISLFVLLVYLGPLWLVLLVLAIQIKCFHEIITIGYTVYRSHELPWFRTLSWYFLVTSNYFLFGENLIDNFRILLSKEELLKPLITYHRFISYIAYCGGIVGFVMSLVKKYYLKQFTLFGWTHMALMIVVVSSHFIIRNIFVGLIWFLVPVSMIICNDIMAYMFGFFLGRTPLIQLSPKKTWEGFIGGAISTVIFGIILSLILVRFDVFVCPLEYDLDSRTLIQECIRNPVFVPVRYELPRVLFFYVPAVYRVIHVCPFVFHSVVLAMFASIVGPFGGFFASGFKRAFGIKDFGDTIPGHGGIMDRFDCQVLMGVFVWVYYASFIRVASPDKLLTQIFAMPAEEQLRLYETLTDALKQNGVLA